MCDPVNPSPATSNNPPQQLYSFYFQGQRYQASVTPEAPPATDRSTWAAKDPKEAWNEPCKASSAERAKALYEELTATRRSCEALAVSLLNRDHALFMAERQLKVLCQQISDFAKRYGNPAA